MQQLQVPNPGAGPHPDHHPATIHPQQQQQRQPANIFKRPSHTAPLESALEMITAGFVLACLACLSISGLAIVTYSLTPAVVVAGSGSSAVLATSSISAAGAAAAASVGPAAAMAVGGLVSSAMEGLLQAIILSIQSALQVLSVVVAAFLGACL